MNWMQQYRQRVIEQERQSEPTPQPKAVSVTVEASERERQSEPTPAPKVASTDRSEVSQRKRKPLPSPLQLNYAYQWLTSFNMEERIRGRCEPVSKCRFLIDWLDDELRKEFLERGNLRWRDWNFLYDDLQRETIENNL